MASQVAGVAAAIKAGLYAQWQTQGNGVHMKPGTFNAIDFDALAVLALTAAANGPDIKPVQPKGSNE